MKYLSTLLCLACSAVAALGQTSGTASLDLWKNGTPPFSFVYGGRPSDSFIASWQKTEEPATPSPGGQTYHYIYTDPATQLKVTADVRTFTDFDAIDWVLHFTNEGTADTSTIEKVMALHLTLSTDNSDVVVHTAAGSTAGGTDFMPKDMNLTAPGAVAKMASIQGRSSEGAFPFFNLQNGGHGLLGAIGWTGNWAATFSRDKTTNDVRMDSGLPDPHFLLHPGESVRSPRILLMNWKGGDVIDSQNLWRRLMLAYYSPKDLQGKTITLPFVDDSWGAQKIDAKLARVTALHDAHVPVDAYWIDADWYGDGKAPNAWTSSWTGNRGNWSANPALYPNGLRPLGDLLKSYHMGFLVWMEAEVAMSGTVFLTQHPDWYLTPPGFTGGQLNLGNPKALKGMTDFVSKWISDSGITWYRQDYNVSPVWYNNDTNDRWGITEMKDVEGLYAYWDALRARSPGLQIDNCASGGRRLDLETITRSAALWRSDAAGDPIGEQCHTQGLAPWVPLNAGVWIFKSNPNSASDIYDLRSSYSAGVTFCSGRLPDAWLKSAVEEFDEVRPYAYGDFYPLTPYNATPNVWSVFQWYRPDLKSGVIVAMRRPNSASTSISVDLRAIDPMASYNVEIRTGLEHGQVQPMSGKDLMHFKITIPDKPGSALVFYKQQ